jgi:hypothetical protein
MTNSQTMLDAFVWNFPALVFEFVWSLGFGYWDLI